MAKSSFTAGFAKARLAEGRAPMVAKIDTGRTTIEMEMSCMQDRATIVHKFLTHICNDDLSIKEVIDRTFPNA